MGLANAGACALFSQQGVFLCSSYNINKKLQEKFCGGGEVGAVRVPLPLPSVNINMVGNQSAMFKNHTRLPLAERQKYVYSQGEPMYDNITPMFGNNTPLFTRQTYIKESRNVYRSKFLSVTGQGSAGGFLLNGIVFDIVEV